MARYGPQALEKVERTIQEMKEGYLKSGQGVKKVASRDRAIASGLTAEIKKRRTKDLYAED